MGNRAVITTSKSLDIKSSSDIGVYLHWNGGRDSVEAFLAYCKLKGYRSPEQDCYGYARLCQVIGNFFGGALSLGIEKCCNLDCDNWDNGVYIIKNWEIVGRAYHDGEEQSEYDLKEMLNDIDQRMPEHDRLGEDFLKADVVPCKEIKIGDEVFVRTYNDKYELQNVGVYGDDYSDNINNYLRSDTVRRKAK